MNNTSHTSPFSLIWIDLEMSGLNPLSDHILEVALIITDKHFNVIATADPWVLYQPNSILDNMDSWNTRTHSQSGLIERCKHSTLHAQSVEKATLQFLKKYVKPQQSPMCGNSICQDRRFLAHHMPKLEKFFHYRNFDVTTFKIMAQMQYPKLFEQVKNTKPAEHKALGDVQASIEEMKIYRKQMLRDQIIE